jgi:putative membrane protein
MFTMVTLVSFAALPALAQHVTDPEAIEEVVEDVIAPDTTSAPPQSNLPVTLPDPGAVPPDDPQRRLDTPEAVFIADALRSGEMAIASARLARDRSDTNELKALAETIERDHDALNDRLRKMQQADAATEPRGQPQHPEMARLQALEGTAFDAAWLLVEESHHADAIGKFERASTSPALAVDVRSAASEALSTLRSHAEAIAALKDSLGY